MTRSPRGKTSLAGRLGTILSSAALALQVALPPVHELQAARAEADYHRGEAPLSGPVYAAEPARPGPEHHHHDASSCRLCPALSGSRAVPSRAAGLPAPWLDFAAFICDILPAKPDHGLASFSPRGPPTA